MGQITKSLMSHCQSVCKHSYGRNIDSILMKFCTLIRGLKSKIEFVWDKNLTTPSPILPQISKNLHYGLWGLQSDCYSVPIKDNCTLCLPTPLFLRSGNLIVLYKFMPYQPLLP